MIDCPSPVDDTEASRILAGYAQYPELVRNLRFWMSTQRIAALTAPEDRRDALELKSLLERELNR